MEGWTSAMCSARLAFQSVCCGGLISLRYDSARLDSTGLHPARLDSTRLNLAQLNSTPLGSAQHQQSRRSSCCLLRKYIRSVVGQNIDFIPLRRQLAEMLFLIFTSANKSASPGCWPREQTGPHQQHGVVFSSLAFVLWLLCLSVCFSLPSGLDRSLHVTQKHATLACRS